MIFFPFYSSVSFVPLNASFVPRRYPDYIQRCSLSSVEPRPPVVYKSPDGGPPTLPILFKVLPYIATFLPLYSVSPFTISVSLVSLSPSTCYAPALPHRRTFTFTAT